MQFIIIHFMIELVIIGPRKNIVKYAGCERVCQRGPGHIILTHIKYRIVIIGVQSRPALIIRKNLPLFCCATVTDDIDQIFVLIAVVICQPVAQLLKIIVQIKRFFLREIAHSEVRLTCFRIIYRSSFDYHAGVHHPRSVCRVNHHRTSLIYQLRQRHGFV